ncbi:hypothetical protein PPIS_b0327 [Pseudoalteromonas piscicida]|uniref:Uncharacterized protein n=1 Tax=Pseudoalteromonas piscicida TaxID=43662 RepID=A0ABM6NKJ4_PSEO7|nr:hypothetical protein PPIS_b0327 [Pseudoalteromonas piscicida]
MYLFFYAVLSFKNICTITRLKEIKINGYCHAMTPKILQISWEI